MSGYITLQESKDMLGIVDNSKDTLLTNMIESVSNFLDVKLDRFQNGRLRYHEELSWINPKRGKKVYMPYNCPIVNVVSFDVYVNGEIQGPYTKYFHKEKNYIKFIEFFPERHGSLLLRTDSGFWAENNIDPLVKEFVKKLVKYEYTRMLATDSLVNGGGLNSLQESGFTVGKFKVDFASSSDFTNLFSNDELNKAGVGIDFASIMSKYGRELSISYF